MAKKNNSPNHKHSPHIYKVRGRDVVLDQDLAKLYAVSTSAFNQAIKRNAARFPSDFAFQLDEAEFTHLISQNVTSKTTHGGRRKLPWVFTEHGAIMAATVLRSEEATSMSVYVVRAFVAMREELTANTKILQRIAEICLLYTSDAADE